MAYKSSLDCQIDREIKRQNMATIHRALTRFEKAVVAQSWKESQPPEYHHAIQAEYENAKTRLGQLIVSHVIGEPTK